MSLTETQKNHFSRQIMLPDIGVDGQQKLLQSKAIIFGLGGLGSIASMYLTATGIGTLKLFDYDEVETSNMQRQIVHNWKNIGMDKVSSAKLTLNELNPNTDIIVDNGVYLRPEQIEVCVADADIVLDCTDNFASRFMLNSCCYKLNIPLISAAAIRFEGQLTSFDFRKSDGACYQCLYPPTGQGETCAEHGILSPVVGVLGSMQALEAVKMLVGLPVLSGKLLVFDAKSMEQRIINFSRDILCEVCAAV